MMGEAITRRRGPASPEYPLIDGRLALASAYRWRCCCGASRQSRGACGTFPAAARRSIKMARTAVAMRLPAAPTGFTTGRSRRLFFSLLLSLASLQMRHMLTASRSVPLPCYQFHWLTLAATRRGFLGLSPLAALIDASCGDDMVPGVTLSNMRRDATVAAEWPAAFTFSRSGAFCCRLP